MLGNLKIHEKQNLKNWMLKLDELEQYILHKIFYISKSVENT